MGITASKKDQIYTKSMNTEIFKVDILKPVFLGSTNKLTGFCEKFPGSSKRTAVCDVLILHSLFIMT